MEAEITVWSVNAFTPSTRSETAPEVKSVSNPDSPASRMLFDQALGCEAEAKIYPRSAMTAGSKVNGPAIITEDETTIILSASCTATTLSDGTIDVTVKGA